MLKSQLLTFHSEFDIFRIFGCGDTVSDIRPHTVASHFRFLRASGYCSLDPLVALERNAPLSIFSSDFELALENFVNGHISAALKIPRVIIIVP
jgi:hypothetical protein